MDGDHGDPWDEFITIKHPNLLGEWRSPLEALIRLWFNGSRGQKPHHWPIATSFSTDSWHWPIGASVFGVFRKIALWKQSLLYLVEGRFFQRLWFHSWISWWRSLLSLTKPVLYTNNNLDESEFQLSFFTDLFTHRCSTPKNPSISPTEATCSHESILRIWSAGWCLFLLLFFFCRSLSQLMVWGPAGLDFYHSLMKGIVT